MGIFDFFKNNEKEREYLEKIEKLEQKIGLKENEISDLINALEKANNAYPKQLEIFDKNIKANKEMISTLEKIADSYFIDIKLKYYQYKIPIEIFYSAGKYKEILTELQKLEINYLDDVNQDIFSSIPDSVKNKDEALQVYLDYLEGKMSWAVITHLNKGEEIKKVYKNNRKFLGLLPDNYVEYMDDLRRFDFKNLINLGVTVKSVNEWIQKAEDYFQNNTKV